MPAKPEKARRIIFVAYAYERECYRNPSFDRLNALPRAMQYDVLRAMEERDAHRNLRQEQGEGAKGRRRQTRKAHKG